MVLSRDFTLALVLFAAREMMIAGALLLKTIGVAQRRVHVFAIALELLQVRKDQVALLFGSHRSRRRGRPLRTQICRFCRHQNLFKSRNAGC